jgi:hypothetical protein
MLEKYYKRKLDLLKIVVIGLEKEKIRDVWKIFLMLQIVLLREMMKAAKLVQKIF